MSLMDEIERLMQSVETSANYRIVNLGGKSLYVEGLKSVICFGDEEMRFQLKREVVIISGTNLKVKYLDSSTCVINGEISSVVVK